MKKVATIPDYEDNRIVHMQGKISQLSPKRGYGWLAISTNNLSLKFGQSPIWHNWEESRLGKLGASNQLRN